jgi:hypothetical protein
VSELRSFLGLANYYRHFIKGYSKLVTHLTDLLKKDWNKHFEAAFQMLKEVVATKPVLSLPNFSQSFKVHTDASSRAIGGVLVQNKYPIAFES